jgi:hypothetical protein
MSTAYHISADKPMAHQPFNKVFEVASTIPAIASDSERTRQHACDSNAYKVH